MRLGARKRLAAQFWFGHVGLCLLTMVCPSIGDPALDEAIRPVRTRQFDVTYRLDTAAEPPRQVELYYTDDRGNTWQRFRSDEDGPSPVGFIAPHEGLFGLYIVASMDAEA